MLETAPASPLDDFAAGLATGDPVAALRDGLIGENAAVTGPFGTRPLIYCDHTASGRALRQVEAFVMDAVLPWYANSHTEASFCGARMTALRRAARRTIARACGAGDGHAVIFCGSGATAGLNRLVHLFGVAQAAGDDRRPLVLIGPYEHHSNILPWRESGAEVRVLPEDPAGGPCRASLDAALRAAAGRDVIGAFSAASNVTGRCTDVVGVTRQMHRAGARVIWDYAAGGPYLPISMTPAGDAPIDAVVLSPHKFVGGPASSGVLIVRRDAVRVSRPTWPGGGTVAFVSPDAHDYAGTLEAREEAGTPNVIGDIRAALAFLVKETVGCRRIAARGAELRRRAVAAFAREPRIELLGVGDIAASLPILSFRVRDAAGACVHHQLITRLLSDVHGVQVRGGCACAGPYVHDLLAISPDASARMRADIRAGRELEKPGFVRMNFSYLMTDATAQRAIDAVIDMARRAPDLAAHYAPDAGTAIFAPRDPRAA